MRGIIALDIDGTIVVGLKPISEDVIKYLLSLYNQGWVFIFVTGRNFQWSQQVLNPLPFPYYMALQNGALIMEWPNCHILSKKYLNADIFPIMESICQEEPTDYVIFSGFEFEDRCYYRPDKFQPKLLEYVMQRKTALKEEWIEVPSFDVLSQRGIVEFASIKCFGDEASIGRIA